MTVQDAETVVRWLYAHRGHPTPTGDSIEAWHAVLNESWIELDDALDILIDHHRSATGSFLMPSDIRAECWKRSLGKGIE